MFTSVFGPAGMFMDSIFFSISPSIYTAAGVTGSFFSLGWMLGGLTHN